LVTRLTLKAETWLPTAATDGRNLIFNPKFVNLLKQKEVEFLCGHEIFHVLLDHCGDMSRMNGRNPKIWNIAVDYAVNSLLVINRIGERITTVETLYDKKYEEWAAEAIYDDLMQNAQKLSMDDLADMILDQHLEDDGDDEEGNGSGNKSGRAKISAEERQQIRDEIKEAMLSAAQASGAGNTPLGMKRLLADLTEPKMNWRQLLQQQIESQVKSDFTYMRPSRKGWGCDAILPGMKREPCVECTIAIDTSGSISGDMIRDFLSEVNGIMAQHASFKIGVMTFDTAVYNYQEFTEDNSDELLTYDVQGGGGTMFECVWEFLKDQEIQPKQLAILTDGYPCGTWGDPDYTDTLFLVHKADIVAPFGVTVKYE
jgi:predicted metal-dependent peptidase